MSSARANISNRPDSFMPLYIGDYLADTAHLSAAEHGAYLLLIMAYWRNGGPLKADELQLMRVTRMNLKEWTISRKVVLAFFVVADGILQHGRIDAELASASAKYQKRKAAADAMHAQRKSFADAMHQQSICAGQGSAHAEHMQPEPEPEPLKKQPDSEAKASAVARAPATAPPAKPNLQKQSFDLGESLGIARPAVGTMAKKCGYDWTAVLDVLRRCQATSPVDPTSWCMAEFAPVEAPTPKPSKLSEALRAARVGER